MGTGRRIVVVPHERQDVETVHGMGRLRSWTCRQGRRRRCDCAELKPAGHIMVGASGRARGASQGGASLALARAAGSARFAEISAMSIAVERRTIRAPRGPTRTCKG